MTITETAKDALGIGQPSQDGKTPSNLLPETSYNLLHAFSTPDIEPAPMFWSVAFRLYLLCS